MTDNWRMTVVYAYEDRDRATQPAYHRLTADLLDRTAPDMAHTEDLITETLDVATLVIRRTHELSVEAELRMLRSLETAVRRFFDELELSQSDGTGIIGRPAAVAGAETRRRLFDLDSVEREMPPQLQPTRGRRRGGVTIDGRGDTL